MDKTLIMCPRCMPPGDPCCPYCGGTYSVTTNSPQVAIHDEFAPRLIPLHSDNSAELNRVRAFARNQTPPKKSPFKERKRRSR